MLTTMIVGCAVLGAAVLDARSGRIPNWLTLPLMPLGLVANGLARGTAGLLEAALGMIVCGFVPWLLFWMSRGDAIGGGDVKLFAGLGALLGPGVGLEAQFASYLFLMLLALVSLAAKGQLWALTRSVVVVLANLIRGRPSREGSPAHFQMRLGPAIAVGTLSLLATDHVLRHGL